MSLPRGLVDQEMAAQIKIDLWAGHMTQSEIAAKYSVSQPTISRIFRGRDWQELPWPDGSLGHIPRERRATIHASRHRKTRYQYDHRARSDGLDDSEIEGISTVVNRLLDGEASRLRATIMQKASESRQRPKQESDSNRPFRGTMLPWPDIKESDPGHPIVQALTEEDDPPLKVALRIVCAKVPQEDWQKPAVLEAIYTEAEKIKEKIA
jgi:hypothetical protein